MSTKSKKILDKEVERKQKPTDGEKRASEVLRMNNSINKGEIEESLTTIEERAHRKIVAGDNEVVD